MSEMWNENLEDCIITDLILGISTIITDSKVKKNYKANDMYGRSFTDRNVHHCTKCDRLWEYDWRRDFHGTKKIIYVPKSNSIKFGKRKEICQRCK